MGALVGVIFGGIELGYGWDTSAIVGAGLAVVLVIFYGPDRIGAGVPPG